MKDAKGKPPARPKGLVSAEKLFNALLGKLGYDPDSYAIFEMWDRLLGHQASKAQALGLKGKRLYVEVDSSAHMHDLMLRKRSLLKKLNDHFGTRRVISDIILELRKSGSVRRTARVSPENFGPKVR